MKRSKARLPRYLTDEQTMQLFRSLYTVPKRKKSLSPTQIRDCCAMFLFYRGAFRRSEVSNLTVNDVSIKTIDNEDGTKTRIGVVIVNEGKTGDRKVFVDEIAVEKLEAWLAIRPQFATADNPYLFVPVTENKCHTTRAVEHDKPTPIAPNYWYNKVRQLSKKEGIFYTYKDKKIPVNIHSIRATGAISMIKEGMSLNVVQDQLGHTTPTMTLHYTRLLAEEREQAIMSRKQPTIKGDKK